MSLLLLTLLPSAPAQVPPFTHSYVVVQDGYTFGWVWSAPGADACHYTEYWYLSEKFTWPSKESGKSFTVAADSAEFKSLDDFVHAMTKESPGGTLLTVQNVEDRKDYG